MQSGTASLQSACNGARVDSAAHHQDDSVLALGSDAICQLCICSRHTEAAIRQGQGAGLASTWVQGARAQPHVSKTQARAIEFAASETHVTSEERGDAW